MKKMRFLLSQLYLLTLMALPFVTASCSDEDDNTLDMEITSLGIEDNTTVYAGQPIQLEAKVSNIQADASYSWEVADKEVSTESKYTFTPDKEGDYKIKLTVKSLKQTIQKSVNIKAQHILYVINEGKFGESGSINSYSQGVWQNKISPTLGGTTTVGTIHNEYMYIVSKDNTFLVKMKMADYSESGKIEKGTDNVLGNNGQANSFCVANDETGILTSSNGAFKVNLSSMTLGEKLSNMDNVRNDKEHILKAGDYIFITVANIIKVYNAKDLSFKQDIAHEANIGFTQSKDGSVWAANDNKLVKINVKTLASEEITLPNGLKVYFNQWAYTPACLGASTTENALYFANLENGSGKEIYKYNIDSNTATKFFSAPASDKSVYGAGINVNPRNGDVFLIYTEDGWGEHYLNTNIHVADGVSGSQKTIIDYSGKYWFPSMILFQ